MNRQEAVRRATELVEQMSVEELASQLRFDADEIPHLDIPEYNWWNEGLHGVARAGTATVFPQELHFGRPMSISSGIPAGGVDMRLMEKTRH